MKLPNSFNIKIYVELQMLKRIRDLTRLKKVVVDGRFW